jgi:hypothetical protein
MAPIVLAFGRAGPALAIEGGTGTHLPGSRDTLAGVVPPSGTYVALRYVDIEGDISLAALDGRLLVDLETSTNIFELIGSQVFEGDVQAGRPAISFTLPAMSGQDSPTTALCSVSGGFTDENSGSGAELRA